MSDFTARLGSVFIPATALMQIEVGLDAYIPTVLTGLPDKPDEAPDETAILYWDSQETYAHSFDTLAVRTYTLTHGAMYAPASGAAFPEPFAGQLTAHQPYHLTIAPQDWMRGQVHHFIGARRDAQRPKEFRTALASALAGFDQTGAAAAIVCAADNHVVYWELHTNANAGPSGLIDQLVALSGWSHITTAEPSGFDHGLWDPWRHRHGTGPWRADSTPVRSADRELDRTARAVRNGTGRGAGSALTVTTIGKPVRTIGKRVLRCACFRGGADCNDRTRTIPIADESHDHSTHSTPRSATMTTPEQPTTTTDDQPAFVFGAVPESPERPGERPLIEVAAPALGPLENFTGTFIGNGFNTIFRPQNPATPAGLPTELPDSDNVLELNLTNETLTFGVRIVGSSGGVVKSLGTVPNRGEVQGDISLNAVPYLQTINDITNGPNNPVGIHFEPGLWVIVPTTTDPYEPGISVGPPQQTLTRLASIPHGTTINAQGTFSSVSGPPTVPTAAGGTTPGIPSVSITPFKTGSPSALITFPSQTAATPNTARIPQDLTSFIGPNGITAQQLLDNPNTLLNDVVVAQSTSGASQTIVSTTTISITTNPATPLFGGGADNIAFLLGDPSALTLAHEQQEGLISAPPPGPGPNAQALTMQATFWIETVESQIVVPQSTAGEVQIIEAEPALPGLPAPRFSVTPPVDITQPRPITVTSTQIQYSQVVFLVFGRLGSLTWPHVSVNTLVPLEPIVVPPSAFN
ncbi:MAG: heme-binding protein [Mycobacterium sp.]